MPRPFPFLVRLLLAAGPAACVLLPSLTHAGGAQAPAKKAEAEAVFRRAVKLFEDQRWDAALTEFRASLAIYPTRAATLNTSICLEKLGRFDEAVDVLEKGLAQTAWSADDSAAIQKKLTELRSLVAEVTVTGAVAGADVLVDSAVRGTTPLAGPLRVGSGSHKIRVEKPGYFPFERSIDVAGKQQVTITATMTPMQVSVTTTAVPPPARVEPPPASVEDRGAGRRTMGLVGMGTGAAGLAVGGIFLALREGTVTEMKDAGCAGVVPAGPKGDKCLSLDDRRGTQRTIGLVGLGAGATLGAVGAILFFTAPRVERSAVRCAPTLAGLSCQGSF